MVEAWRESAFTISDLRRKSARSPRLSMASDVLSSVAELQRRSDAAAPSFDITSSATFGLDPPGSTLPADDKTEPTHPPDPMSTADTLLEGVPADGHELKKTLTTLDLFGIGIGGIVGAGIYVLTGQAAADYAGPAVVISFIVAGVACCFAALCYSELAAMIPVSGSAYSFSSATMGELAGWIIGWDLLLEYLFGAAGRCNAQSIHNPLLAPTAACSCRLRCSRQRGLVWLCCVVAG